MSERLGKYRLLKRLATGGMAEIWLARQEGVEGFEKLVVVKRILPHLTGDESFVRMFLDEARLAAQLSHPHIVQIFELGRDDEAWFIAMEFIHGENLRLISRAAAVRGEHMPVPVALKIVSQICEALSYAHTKTDLAGQPLGVVHRDISPQNLLVSFEGLSKVVDFGIAKAATQVERTRAGVLKGKYAYMSPEQCRGEPLDGRSDLFSVGIVLWEVLTGRRLYKRQNELMILRAVCEEPPIRPTQLRPDLPPEVEDIVLRALAKRRDDRYADCHEMHLACETWLRSLGRPFGTKDLADYVSRLFPEKLALWRELSVGEAAPDLAGRLFDDAGASGLPEGDGAADTPSGAQPLLEVSVAGEPVDHRAVAQGPSTAPTSAAAPILPAGPPPGARSAASVQRRNGPSPALRRGLTAAAALALLAGGAWLYQGVVGPALEQAPAVASEPAQPAPTGTFLITSEPTRARVLIDDELRGEETPLTLDGIPLGRSHHIRVEAAGYEAWETEVRLDAAATTRRISARLTKRTVAAATAVLEVVSDPSGAEVTLDGRPVGRTPLKIEVQDALPTSIVRVDRDGFAPEARALDLGPGKHQRWEVVLQPSEPPDRRN